jgi:SpoVK/Ycf46/Vps4 family AAA+-type ATPase
LINSVAAKLSKKVYTWDGLTNLEGDGRAVPDTEKPEALLEHIRTTAENGIYVLFDFHPYLRPEANRVIRRMRRTAFDIKRSYKTVIIVSPVINIPQELEKQVTILNLPLPRSEELMSLLKKILESARKSSKLQVDADDELLEQVCKAARGLTLAEAKNLFQKAVVSDFRFGPEDLSLILAEKRQILRKTGVLDYFETSERMNDVGGLQRLKNWLEKRRKAFSDSAREFGLPQPKGLLLLGVQGCGKSLVAKAVASLWQIPLLRLDVGSLFSSYIGSTEANMRKAIRIAESIAPVVLWLDEIEKGLSGLESSGSVDAGVTARIFSSFLLWMQEKTAPVFVVATANDVRRLPPELLRKGRFDEIFFVDLPRVKERKEIFAIHLEKKNRNPGNFDVAQLAGITEGYSGAEIEQIIVAGLYNAFAAGQGLRQEDLVEAAGEMVPLSQTMAENIQNLRSWAQHRALPAS